MIKAIDLLEMSPVIAAIKDDAGLKRCLDTECQVVFILYGNICNIKDIVAKLKAHGKCAMVHADLVQGLGSKEVAIDFIKEQTGADGIISTKPMLVRRAQELKMFGILRAFIIDSMAVANTQKMLDTFRPELTQSLQPDRNSGIFKKWLTFSMKLHTITKQTVRLYHPVYK